jgi:hypothetical protein
LKVAMPGEVIDMQDAIERAATKRRKQNAEASKRTRDRKAGKHVPRRPTGPKPRAKPVADRKPVVASATPATTAKVPPGRLSPEPAADVAHVVSLGLRMALALAVAIGAYSVLHDVLAPLYPGWGAVWRALTPLGVEAIVGHALYAQLRGKSRLGGMDACVIAGAVLAIALCVAAELAAASAAPAVAKRARVSVVLSQAAQPQASVTLKDAPDGEGRRGKLEHERNQGKALDLEAAQQADVRELRQQQLANAKESTLEEAWLPTLLTVLGTIGSASVTVLLEGFLRGVRSLLRRR